MKSTFTRKFFLGAHSFFSLLGIAVALIPALAGCDSSGNSSKPHDSGPEEQPLESPADNMILIKAAGKSATLDKKLTAEFSYDFYIGKHEVTCGEYSATCENDSLPQVDVTFYDAVLFANKISKEQGYDTAYTYSKVVYNSKGNATLLNNFQFHPERKAYRLPTEAEWVLAAQGNFDVEHSWNADNSDYEAHAVCSGSTGSSARATNNSEVDANNNALCDMAGNVAEWVYDWSHKTSDTTVTNFIGPAQPNAFNERILKGGNFRNDPDAISITRRTDIYTVTPSTSSDYVGFRLAFGPIPSPTWIGEFAPMETDTSDADTNASVLEADSAGAYYKSGGSENASMLRYKLELLWQYRNQSKLVILGSSRSMYGIKPLLMDSSLTAINMSQIPNSLFVSDFLLKNYVVNHVKNLKYLVLSVDFDMWWRDENDSYDNFFLSEYKFYPGYVYDENHDFWKDGYPEGLLENTHEAPGLDVFKENFMPSRGFMAEPGTSWGENPTVDYDSTWVEKNPKLYAANLNKLKEMIALANEHKIKVIGIIFPQHPGYVSTGSYSRYGPRRSQADSLIQEIADISKDYSNFILWDEHKAGYHDYADSLASSKDHLNEKGAQVLTSRLDSLIKTLE